MTNMREIRRSISSAHSVHSAHSMKSPTGKPIRRSMSAIAAGMRGNADALRTRVSKGRRSSVSDDATIATTFSTDEGSPGWSSNNSFAGDFREKRRSGKGRLSMSSHHGLGSGGHEAMQLQSSKHTQARLDELEITKLRFEANRLYGRDEEIQDVLSGNFPKPVVQPSASIEDVGTGHDVNNANDTTNSTAAVTAATTGNQNDNQISNTKNMVYISGAPGIGKSVFARQVIHELLKETRRRRRNSKVNTAFVCSSHGKFDSQHSHADPYSAISQVLQNLWGQIAGSKDSDSPTSVGSTETKTGGHGMGHRRSRGSGDSDAKSVSTLGSKTHYQQSKRAIFSNIHKDIHKEMGINERSILSTIIPALQPQTKSLVRSSSVSSLRQQFRQNQQQSQRQMKDVNFSEDQFKLIVRQLLRIVTRHVALLVCVIDDLQWADTASLDLLASIFQDNDLHRFVVLGTYRSNEPSALLQASMQNMDKLSRLNHNVVVKHVSLQNLTVDQVYTMLDDVLMSASSSHTPPRLASTLPLQSSNHTLSLDDSESVSVAPLAPLSPLEQLAHCVHAKTSGNPFFIKQFLMHLVERDLLTFHLGLFTWKWDVPTIQQETSATDNVIDILQRKMRDMPMHTQQLLPAMASLGSHFSTHIFRQIAIWKDQLGLSEEFTLPSSSFHHDADDNASSHSFASDSPTKVGTDDLLMCEDYGFVEKISPTQYKWVHDRIREAATLLIESEQLILLQFRVAQLLIEHLDPVELEEVLFTVVNLLNTQSHKIRRSSPERMDAIYLNLRAGEKAAESSAFAQAAQYLDKGIALLPINHWQSHTDLSLELYSRAAEANVCCGNGASEHTQWLCHVIINQPRVQLLDKQAAYNVLLVSMESQDRMEDGMNLCLDVLAKLDCKFPKRMIQAHVVMGAIKLMQKLRSVKPDDLMQLPKMTDQSKIWVLKLIDKLTTFAYFLGSDLQALAVFQAFWLTLKCGLSDEAPLVIAQIGVTLACHLGDTEGGKLYADCAISMIEAGASPQFASRVYFITNGLVQHWTCMATLTRKFLWKGYQAGLTVGDTNNALFCIYMYLEYGWRSGSSISQLAPNLQMYARQMIEFNLPKIRDYTWITLHNLTAMSGDHSYLDDDVPSLHELRAHTTDHHQATISLAEMNIAFMLGDYSTLIKIMYRSKMHQGSFLVSMMGLVASYQLYFCNAIGCISRYYETKTRKYLRLARAFTNKVRRWEKQGNPNLRHCVDILNAEWASLRRKNDAVEKHFDSAILQAGRSGVTHHHALAHQRAGEHYLRLKDITNAKYHMEKAVELYDDWGAFAITKSLRNRFPTALSPTMETVVPQKGMVL